MKDGLDYHDHNTYHPYNHFDLQEDHIHQHYYNPGDIDNHPKINHASPGNYPDHSIRNHGHQYHPVHHS